jgi:hypothetical protein
MLLWSLQQQSDWYRSIERVYKVGAIEKGSKVHPLPKADTQIDFTYEYGGKTWTVGDDRIIYVVRDEVLTALVVAVGH